MTLLVILIALIMLCLILSVVAVMGDFYILEQCAGIGLFISYVVFVVIGITMAINTPNHEPTALDVYRGKTILEITYRDSVAVDSVVVYKMK